MCSGGCSTPHSRWIGSATRPAAHQRIRDGHTFRGTPASAASRFPGGKSPGLPAPATTSSAAPSSAKSLHPPWLAPVVSCRTRTSSLSPLAASLCPSPPQADKVARCRRRAPGGRRGRWPRPALRPKRSPCGLEGSAPGEATDRKNQKARTKTKTKRKRKTQRKGTLLMK